MIRLPLERTGETQETRPSTEVMETRNGDVTVMEIVSAEETPEVNNQQNTNSSNNRTFTDDIETSSPELCAKQKQTVVSKYARRYTYITYLSISIYLYT